MPRTLPKRGRILLEDGELVARTDAGDECGRLYVGPDGVIFEGELTLFQDLDPAKLRFLSRFSADQAHGYVGGISGNYLREDGRGDEIGYAMFGVAEDAQRGSRRGQAAVYLRRVTQEEPTPALVITSAYSLEAFNGLRRLYVALAHPFQSLWKFTVGEGVEDDRIPVVEPPNDDWLTPESQQHHAQELAALDAEFAPPHGAAGFGMDEKTRAAYMLGRNRDLRSLHDDLVDRLGYCPATKDPARAHPAGATY